MMGNVELKPTSDPHVTPPRVFSHDLAQNKDPMAKVLWNRDLVKTKHDHTSYAMLRELIRPQVPQS